MKLFKIKTFRKFQIIHSNYYKHEETSTTVVFYLRLWSNVETSARNRNESYDRTEKKPNMPEVKRNAPVYLVNHHDRGSDITLIIIGNNSIVSAPWNAQEAREVLV